MRGRISLSRTTCFFLLLFHYGRPCERNLIVKQHAALSRHRGARSQRTIKKSTKNKLRSAYPPDPLSPVPFALLLLSRAALLLVIRALQLLGCVWARMHSLPSSRFVSLRLSLSFSGLSFLSFFLRSVALFALRRSATSPPRASLPSFSRGLFGVGHGEAVYERLGNGEKSVRGKKRVCTAACARRCFAAMRLSSFPCVNNSLYRLCSLHVICARELLLHFKPF